MSGEPPPGMRHLRTTRAGPEAISEIVPSPRLET